MDGKDGDGLHFEKFSLEFYKVLVPILEQNQKCAMDYSSRQKLIDVLVLNFKVTFSAHVKVRKKGFFIVLAGRWHGKVHRKINEAKTKNNNKFT